MPTVAYRAEVEKVRRCWQAYLRRFNLEHTFRLFQAGLGLNSPKIRFPQVGRPKGLKPAKTSHSQRARWRPYPRQG